MSEEFKIIDTEETPVPDIANTMLKRAEMEAKNRIADEWMKSTGLPMIKYTRDLKDLEKQWANFTSYQHDYQHRSDEESIRIYGYDNDYRYEVMKDEIMKFQNNVIDDHAHMKKGEEIITDRPLKESADNDELAYAWSRDTNIPIITDKDCSDIEDLEDAYNRYMNTDYYNRKRSDARSTEIYGGDNLTRYKIALNILSHKEDKQEYDDKHSEKKEYEHEYDVDTDIPLVHEATENKALSKKLNVASRIFYDMNDLTAGFYDTKTKTNTAKSKPEYYEDYNWLYQNWKLLKPSTLKRYGCGLSFDFVELERYEMEKAGIDVQSYFIAFTDLNKGSHAFLTFQDEGRYFWIEKFWYEHDGIHRYDSLEDMLSDIADKFIHGDQSKIADIFCKPYPKPEKYGMNMKDFYAFVMGAETPTSESTIMELALDYAREDSKLGRANILFKMNKISKAAEEKSNFCEMVYVNKFINDAIRAESKDMVTLPKLRGTPFFSPEELLDLGVFANDRNYFSSNPDNTQLDDGVSSNQWFINYMNRFNGTICENMTPQWLRKMRELYRDYDAIKECGDERRIRARQQSILELGWNPALDFTEDNLRMAEYRINAILEMNSKKFDHIDLTYTTTDPVGEYLDKAIDNGDISPVYIILQKGNALISHAIKAFTSSDYTHASIGFDANMKENYSYISGGFTNEDFAAYGDDDITVYAFFVKNNVMDKLKNTLQDFKNNTKKSVYDIRKLFDYIVDNTKRKTSQYAQVCSTFVDNMLKSAGIEITKPTRGIVSPKDIETSMNEHKGKIYKVYDGPAKKYNPRKTKNKLYQIINNKSFKPLKEATKCIPEELSTLLFITESDVDTLVENSTVLTSLNKQIYESFVEPQVLDIYSVLETKLFPAQFDNEGNLLIYKNKLKKLDYNQEFEESNKLCQIYAKNQNIEGLKYELAKLWFMNNSIEKLLKTSHNKDLERKELIDCRARILNVFYSMMDEVNNHEKNFNFVEYYNKTPFSDAIVKVNATTIKYTLATLKSLVH